MKKKIVVAYSGGLNSTVCITWLKENQDFDVYAVCVDVGQAADFKAIKKRAVSAGAVDCQIVDVKKEFVEQYFLPALKAGAVYDNKCISGTPSAHMFIAKAVVEYAKTIKAAVAAYGADTYGNSHIRLTFGILALAPEMEIIVPWNIWKLKNRKDLFRYLARRKLQSPEAKKESYVKDSSILHFSHEGLDLEDPANEPQYRRLLSMTVNPEKAPNKPEYIEMDFINGVPVAINGKAMDSVALVNQLNKIGGANGIGIIDTVENQIMGVKKRFIYEVSGAAILSFAHNELEHICLDSQSFTFKQKAASRMGELIYSGLWFSPLRTALSAFVESTQQVVSGKVRVKLYKGSISLAGVSFAEKTVKPKAVAKAVAKPAAKPKTAAKKTAKRK